MGVLKLLVALSMGALCVFDSEANVPPPPIAEYGKS